ncbi:MAG: hypothetical protein OFPI_36250 [Osedax symbiont Rs2]|nr:MAG: hypothetical protein OFPI_36250 [Osedax symbiont Rs2]
MREIFIFTSAIDICRFNPINQGEVLGSGLDFPGVDVLVALITAKVQPTGL